MQDNRTQNRHGYRDPAYGVDVPGRAQSEQELQVREYIASYVRRRYDNGETYLAIAEDLHISKTQAQHLARGWKAGAASIDAVARKLFGGSVDKLRAAAAEHWKASGAKARLAPQLLAQRNPELAKAIDFLRGQIPDNYLDGWVAAQADQGWKGVDRDGFVTLIRAKFLQDRTSATSDLERARAESVAKSHKK